MAAGYGVRDDADLSAVEHAVAHALVFGDVPEPEQPSAAALPAPPPPFERPAVAAALAAIYRPMTLFSVDGEQATFDDLDWGAPAAAEKPAKKTRPAQAKRTGTRLALRPVIPLKDLDGVDGIYWADSLVDLAASVIGAEVLHLWWD